MTRGDRGPAGPGSQTWEMTSQSFMAFLPVNTNCTHTVCSLTFLSGRGVRCRISPPLISPSGALFDAHFNPLSCVRQVGGDGSHLWSPWPLLFPGPVGDRTLWHYRYFPPIPGPLPGARPPSLCPAASSPAPTHPWQLPDWHQLEAEQTCLLGFQNACLKLLPDVEERVLMRWVQVCL